MRILHIVTDSSKCSGCTACCTVCPVNAISMISDGEGFLIPTVSKKKCVDCGKCIKVCPAEARIQTVNTLSDEIKAYAIKWESPERTGSASGGFFPAIAKYFIEEKEGFVCGCVLESLQPIHIVSNQWGDILRMRDSKYVQSDMRMCFKEISQFLEQEKYVLFTGTSCQIAGLLSALADMKVNTERLLTIDFFCHGVPSPKVWQDYLKFYEKEKNRKLVDYRFRSKKYGWGKAARGSSYLNSAQYLKGNLVKRDNVSYVSRMWRTIFFSNICIRMYCHSCPYASLEKPADITMGDFWGVHELLPNFDDGKGSSIALLRNEKAKQFVDNISYLTKEEISVEQAIKKQRNAFHPSEVHAQREEFWKDYEEKNFRDIAEKYFHYTFSYRVKSLVKRILFALHLRDI